MKFIVSSTALLSHLQIISRVINSKNSMAILENFLFELKGNNLTVTASDQETTMNTTIEVVEASGEGRFAVSAKILLDPLKELPEQPLSFEINDDNLEIFINYQNGHFNLMGVNGSEYPQARPLSDEAATITMPAERLLKGIGYTLFATADDTYRPIMNGINFDIFPDNIAFVASDIHKLVRFRDLSIQAGLRASFILPKKPATLLKAILPKESEDVNITFDEKSARFTLSNFVLTCRLIEGNYPNYNSVIPQNSPNVLTIDRSLFVNVLRRVSVFSDQALGLIELAFDDHHMVVSTQNIDYSISATETVNCNYMGTPFTIGFNAPKLIEVFNTIQSDEVTVALSDASRAGVICPLENDENEELLMLLMPMLLNK
ncbi:MAG: DNA polymerase III subunit beta [Bacteroidaceae bacterium]|nr:DNA polymerase III subunit beta [Bacteroidaceae bacterium]